MSNLNYCEKAVKYKDKNSENFQTIDPQVKYSIGPTPSEIFSEFNLS